MTNQSCNLDSATGDLASELLELGGSVVRFAWAMTVLGAQQAVNLVASSASGWPSSVPHPFDAAANKAEEQFGGVFRGVYRTGREYIPWLGGGRREAGDPAA